MIELTLKGIVKWKISDNGDAVNKRSGEVEKLSPDPKTHQISGSRGESFVGLGRRDSDEKLDGVSVAVE